MFQTRALIDWLCDVPDPRCSRVKLHPMAEIFTCMVLGFLAGRTSLRRIISWSKRNVEKLRKYLPFPNGVPSLSTMSRVLSSVDEEMVAYAFMNWIGEISNTRGTHIAIDGKGLRAAADKVRDERTPYILNAIDVASKFVVAQLAISAKGNEMTAIPELLMMLEISGSTVTVDAIGATENIMNAVCNGGADFVLQVKGNCPALYGEIERLFTGLETDRDAFIEKMRKAGMHYSESRKTERNRDRHEYRECQSYSDSEGIVSLQEERPHIACVGRLVQTRILKVVDETGNDVTPSLEDFLRDGSSRQPKKEESIGQSRCGLISSRLLDAEKLMEYKRNHWAIENSLHYVLDETFGEDKSTVKRGRNTVSVLRKCAYNIIRLLQMEAPEKRKHVPDVIDDICEDLEVGLKMFFCPVPSLY